MVDEMARVLIVDDNKINIKAIAEALRDECRIMAATNYRQVMNAVLGDTPPDLILLDIVMPDVDGFETFRRLKSNPLSSNIPIIFITAMDDEADETRGLSMGAVDYIAKPIVPAVVRARVRTHLELRRHTEALERAYATIQAQKERMEQELKVGQKLQLSLQPQLPHGEQFEVAASMCSAREVSGDFYDVFYVDPWHLCVCIGDVSGKGVPAALFMSMSRTLVRTKADKVLSTGQIVTEVNRAIVGSNDACMFVTMVVAMLDTRSGQMTYTNAGHTSPLIVDASGEVVKLPGRHGMAVGVEEVIYREDSLLLDPSRTILFYTDGVTEARDPQDGLFGETRLMQSLVECAPENPGELIESVTREVDRFEAGTEHADDITLLSLRYRGDEARVSQSNWEVSITGDDLAHRHVTECIGDFLSSIDVPRELYDVVYLVLEELVTNIVDYGYPGEDTRVDVGIRIEIANGAVVVHICDDGIAFNPLDVPCPDTSLPLIEREAGGLGIHLCRQLMDEAHYERRNLHNHLRMVKRMPDPTTLSPDRESHAPARPGH